MAKIFFLILSFFVLAICLTETNAASGECPGTAQIYSCSPKCIQDTDCSYGKKCCPNSCNTKSCAEPKTTGSSSGKGGSSGGSGSYCNNVKCNSYEKCELDRSTKRMKCVRS
ncbi:waprin-like protein [Arctopsyche grandis]|uniref:waprin-like protein n=1 Tax=Arctopsyche grandis TaxID=121162 RepID=UPI00406D747C